MYQIVNQTIPVAQLGGATFEIQRRTLSVQTASGETVLFDPVLGPRKPARLGAG